MFIFSQSLAIVNVVKEDFPFFKDLILILIVLKRGRRKEAMTKCKTMKNILFMTKNVETFAI